MDDTLINEVVKLIEKTFSVRGTTREQTILDAKRKVRDEIGAAYGVDVDIEHLDLDYKEGEAFMSATLVFGNLYTFVLLHGVYVPYWDWIYEECYENEDFKFEQRALQVVDGFTGEYVLGYRMENKGTGASMIYAGKQLYTTI